MSEQRDSILDSVEDAERTLARLRERLRVRYDWRKAASVEDALAAIARVRADVEREP